MKNHNFCYNYGFLADWFKSNPDMKKYGVMEKLGMSYYRTVQNWIDGETMMPLTQMMKFCNLFNVPISAFFYDECADEESNFTPLHDDAVIEPAGGWKDADRKLGIKTGDPRTEEHIHTKLPTYVRRSISNSINIKEEGQAEELIPQNERMRYLDIIESLSKRVSELLKENARLRQEEVRPRDYRSYMVAED